MPRSPRGHSNNPKSLAQVIFIGLIMLFVLFSRLGLLPFLLGAGIGRMSGHHRSGGVGGFGGGGFGGGGFSGGGGGFSGGGASGGW
jgi:uncharacterized protein